MRSLVLFLVVIQCISAFRAGIHLTSLQKARGCFQRRWVGPLKGVPADRLEFGDKVQVSVKLPSSNRNIVENFLRNPDFIVENVWDKLKTTKTSDNTYLLELSAIPVCIPGFSIVNPEADVKLSCADGAAYVNFESWQFKDGCGNALKDTSFVESVQVELSGKIRILHNDGAERSEGFSSSTTLAAKKKPKIGGEPLYLECSVHYRVVADRPTRLPVQDFTAVEEKTRKLLQYRVHDFMHLRLPQRLVKAFKAYGAKVQQSTEYWL